MRIATEDVLAVLGVADGDLLFDALDAIADGDSRAALLAAAALTQSGRDALGFVRDLEAHARDLMIVQTLGEVPAELQITPDRDARLEQQAGRVGTGAVARLIDLLAAALDATKNGSDARTQLELALVKAAAPAIDPTRQALLQRIERLEHALRGMAPTLRRAVASACTRQRRRRRRRADAEPLARASGGLAAASASPTTPVQPQPPPRGAVAVAAPATLQLDLDSLRAVWPAVLEQVKTLGQRALRGDARRDAPGRRRRRTDHDRLLARRRLPHAQGRGRRLPRAAWPTRCARSPAPRRRSPTCSASPPSPPSRPDPPTDSEWVERFVAEFDAEEIHPESEAS